MAAPMRRIGQTLFNSGQAGLQSLGRFLGRGAATAAGATAPGAAAGATAPGASTGAATGAAAATAAARGAATAAGRGAPTFGLLLTRFTGTAAANPSLSVVSGATPTAATTATAAAATRNQNLYHQASGINNKKLTLNDLSNAAELKELINTIKTLINTRLSATADAVKHAKIALDNARKVKRGVKTNEKAYTKALNDFEEALEEHAVTERIIDFLRIKPLPRTVIPIARGGLISNLRDLLVFESQKAAAAAVRITNALRTKQGLSTPRLIDPLTYFILTKHIVDLEKIKGKIQGELRPARKIRLLDDNCFKYRDAKKENVKKGSGKLTAAGEHENPIDFLVRALMMSASPNLTEKTAYILEVFINIQNDVRLNYDGNMPPEVNTGAMNTLYSYAIHHNVSLTESWNNLSDTNKKLINDYHDLRDYQIKGSDGNLIMGSDGKPIKGIERIIYVGKKVQEAIYAEQKKYLDSIKDCYDEGLIDDNSIEFGHTVRSNQYKIAEEIYKTSSSAGAAHGGALSMDEKKLIDAELVDLLMLTPDSQKKTPEEPQESTFNAAKKIIELLNKIQETKEKIYNDVEAVNKLQAIKNGNTSGGGKTRRYRARRQTRRLRKSRGTMKRKQKKTRRQK
jgi:hypothetical protein